MSGIRKNRVLAKVGPIERARGLKDDFSRASRSAARTSEASLIALVRVINYF